MREFAYQVGALSEYFTQTRPINRGDNYLIEKRVEWHCRNMVTASTDLSHGHAALTLVGLTVWYAVLAGVRRGAAVVRRLPFGPLVDDVLPAGRYGVLCR